MEMPLTAQTHQGREQGGRDARPACEHSQTTVDRPGYSGIRTAIDRRTAVSCLFCLTSDCYVLLLLLLLLFLMASWGCHEF